MLAPKDARVVVKAGGEEIALRLNFASMARAKAKGIDLLSESVPDLSELDGLTLVACLAQEERPEFDENWVMALIEENKQGVANALVELFEQYGGKASGNRKGRKAKKAA